MKRFGYKLAFAGGVEATSSMGGQIMPPVIGAVAFIMAETIGVPYIEICKAAIPALLYFPVLLLDGAPGGRPAEAARPAPAECPSAWCAVHDGWYLILPLAALVTLLLGGYTPLFSGTVGLALTAVLILGMAVVLMLQAGGWLDTLYMSFKAVLAIGLWGAAAIGFLRGPLSWPERVLTATATFSLVLALSVTDEIGFALSALFVLWHGWRVRRVVTA